MFTCKKKINDNLFVFRNHYPKLKNAPKFVVSNYASNVDIQIFHKPYLNDNIICWKNMFFQMHRHLDENLLNDYLNRSIQKTKFKFYDSFEKILDEYPDTLINQLINQL